MSKSGTGKDWNGGAYTKAACQSVLDNLYDPSIVLFKQLG
jgi:hypothetical protein